MQRKLNVWEYFEKIMQETVKLQRWVINTVQSVEHFNHFRTAITNRNFIYKENKRSYFFKSENACYYSKLNLLSLILPSQNIKINLLKPSDFFTYHQVEN
jgi:hypothetical protein